MEKMDGRMNNIPKVKLKDEIKITYPHGWRIKFKNKLPMRKYLYESHLGGLYTSEEYLDDLYCETCGDSDWLIGTFSTINEFWDLIEDKCNIECSGGYSLQYVYPIIVSEFELPDTVEYNDSYEQDCGYCCNNEQDILCRIEELIGRKVNRIDE